MRFFILLVFLAMGLEALAQDVSDSDQSKEIALDEGIVLAQSANLATWDTGVEFNDDWGFGTFNILGNRASSGISSDGVSITTGIPDRNFAFWQIKPTATHIPKDWPGIFRSRWTIKGDMAPELWPPIFLRLFENENHQVYDLFLYSKDIVPPAGVSQTYEMFYVPTSDLTDDINFGMFVMDTSVTQGGTVMLESVVIDNIVGLDQLFTTDMILSASGDRTFNDVKEIDITPYVKGSKSADAFTWVAVVLPYKQFAFDIAQITMFSPTQTDRLYRLTCDVSSTTPKYSQVAWRFRLFPERLNYHIINSIIPAGYEWGHMPGTSPRSYTTFLSTRGFPLQDINAAFDIVHNNAYRSGNVTWSYATLDSIDLNLIP